VPSRCRSPARAAGFTLIEVLVALTIAGLALAAIAGVFGTGAIGHRTAADADIALALAEEKLAGAEATAAIRPGRSGGTYDGRFDWRVSVARYDDAGTGAAFTQTPLPAPNAANLQLYRIEAGVAWSDGRHRRQLELSTLRLLPERQ
jgi:prepilin-type N-terminal cleavage/methylation domain-containing protein